MSHTLLNMAGQRWALGLSWSVHETRAAALAHARSLPQASRVLACLATQVDPSLPPARSWLLGLLNPAPPEVARSAALAIGLVHPDAVVCQHLPDGQAWLCAIAQGLPLPEHDRLLGAAEAAAQLPQLLLHAGVLIGDLPGAHHELPAVLAQLAARARPCSRRAWKQTQLRMASSLRRRLLQWGLLLAMLLATFQVWWHWRDWQRIERGRLQDLARRLQGREQQEAQAEVRRQRLQAHAQAVLAQREALSHQAGGAALQWERWNQVRLSLPLSHKGYVPQRLFCDVQRCQVSWVARSPWARLADRAGLPGVGGAAQAEALQGEFPLLPLPAASLPGVPMDSSLHLQLAGSLQFAAPDVQLEPPAPVVVAAAPELGLPGTAIGRSGALSLQLQGPLALLRAHEAVQALAAWPVQLLQVTWNEPASAQPAVALKGRYIQWTRAGGSAQP